MRCFEIVFAAAKCACCLNAHGCEAKSLLSVFGFALVMLATHTPVIFVNAAQSTMLNVACQQYFVHPGYMVEHLGIPEDKVSAITSDLYLKYGTTMAGLVVRCER